MVGPARPPPAVGVYAGHRSLPATTPPNPANRAAESDMSRALTRSPLPLVAFGALALAACSLFAAGALHVTAAPDAFTTAPGEPVTIIVTAENTGDDRVEWGEGSSSCQLRLLVRVDGEDLVAPQSRACTDDLAPWTLGPGGSRTESFAWEGLVRRDERGGPIERLAPGTYELRGAAGSAAYSEAIRIELREAAED